MEQHQEFKAEFDFHDLLKRPAKLFGYGYIYVLVIAVGMGVVYVSSLTVIGKNSVAPVLLKDSSAFVQDIPLQTPSVLPPVDIAKVSKPSDALLTRGRELFKANCASCHGETGMGDGLAGGVMNPKPRNFHSLRGWTNGSKVSQIYMTLQEGIVKNGMASYNYLSPEDRFALIHAVRNFAPGQPMDTPEELQQLEVTYQLSKGSNIPGQIPIRKAAQLVLAESAPRVSALAKEAASTIADGAPGAVVLRRFAANPRRVLAGLTSHPTALASLDDFIRVVSADPLVLGLKAGVLRLSRNEWIALYEYLTELRARL